MDWSAVDKKSLGEVLALGIILFWENVRNSITDLVLLFSRENGHTCFVFFLYTCSKWDGFFSTSPSTILGFLTFSLIENSYPIDQWLLQNHFSISILFVCKQESAAFCCCQVYEWCLLVVDCDWRSRKRDINIERLASTLKFRNV